jgi:hypothetical protein
MSISKALRDRFMSGDTLSSGLVQKEYGCSSGLLGLVVKQMQTEGYKFKRVERREDGKVFADWTLTKTKEGKNVKAEMPAGPASTWPAKDEAIGEVEAIAAEIVEPRPESRNGRVELPRLGQQVTVSLLSVNEQGIVSIGLRDGSRTWLVQLTAHTEKSI